jgi:RNA polymerase sigma-70 factor (ECF subfamily)
MSYTSGHVPALRGCSAGPVRIPAFERYRSDAQSAWREGVTGTEAAGFRRRPDEAGRDEEVAFAAGAKIATFQLLYERHRAAVFRYLRARSGSDEDAVELTAVTFEHAIKAIGRYRRGDGGVLPWLFTIARNAANDADRARRRRDLVPLDDTEVPDPGRIDDGILRRERLAELRARVDRLPAPQREAVLLRYAGDLTAKEIGATLGKSEAAAQKMLSRALATLREAYRDDD